MSSADPAQPAQPGLRFYVRVLRESGLAYPGGLFLSLLLAKPAVHLPNIYAGAVLPCVSWLILKLADSKSSLNSLALPLPARAGDMPHDASDASSQAQVDPSEKTAPQPSLPHNNAFPPGYNSFKLNGLQPPMPECWGHRGASAAFPENTIASFDRAIRDGSEGLESDVHVTADDVIVMFHDPSLERTTDGTGLIKEQAWKGQIENFRTTAKPQQQIPTFDQVCNLLMKPENKHVKLNIDIKPDNDPDRLFRLMKKVVSSYPNYEAELGPRLILGLWHPGFIAPALEHVPSLRRIHIGGSPTVARTYFWKHCDGFSMWFASLVGTEGQAFLAQAKRENKDVFVWTVNRKDEMIEATRWGVKAILTDKTDLFQTVRLEMQRDFALTRSEEVGLFFRWASWRYWMLPQFVIQSMWIANLQTRAGSTFEEAWRASPARTGDVQAALDEKVAATPAGTLNTAAIDLEKGAIATDAAAPPAVAAVA